MPNWKKLIISGSNAALNSVTASNGFFGTASWAQNAVSASWAPGGTPITFINANPGGGSYSNLTTLYVSGSGVTISNPSPGIVSMSISGGAGGSGTTFVGGTNVDNRIITATGTTPELNGEANLTFDGSLLSVTGSLIVAPGSSRELFVTNSGVTIGNALTDVHQVTGSLRVLGSITGSLFGTASFATLAASANAATFATTAGSASKADQLQVIRISGTASFFPTFVDSNNGTFNYEQLYTVSSITFIPDAGSITANSFTGSLRGTASTASLAQNSLTASTILVYRTASNATWYIPFVDSVGATGGSPESLFTTEGSSLYFNPSNGSLTTTSFTGSLRGTASFATTASYVNLLAGPNITINYQSNGIAITGSAGGSGSPGGANTNIQFNSGSTFAGSDNLTYDYRTTGASQGRVSHLSNIDHGSSAATTGSGAFLIKNNMGLTDRQQFTNIFHTQWRVNPGSGDTKIMSFDANGSNSPAGDLRMYGFKCDYGLMTRDAGTGENRVSRVGTLWGAWTYDDTQAPVLNETAAQGDTIWNELVNATFTLAWNGANVQLNLNVDAISNADEVYFSGLFTTFGTSL